MISRLVFATGNPGKLREAREILGPGFEVLSPADVGLHGFDVEETGSTFRENSLLKARALWQACGLPCFADDSGLEVDALGGAPGIYSARYASDHNFSSNIDRLLAELNALEPAGAPPSGVRPSGSPHHPFGTVPPLPHRGCDAPQGEYPQTFPGKARFRCVATLIPDDGKPRFFEGACEGRIATMRHGEGGFGYDPVFVPDDYPDRTISQLPEDVKNAISHRGVALRLLAAFLSTKDLF